MGMDENDKKPLMMLGDVAAAVGLLTRLPVRVSDEIAVRKADAAWAYPIAGLLVAMVGGIVGQLMLWIGLPAQVVAVLVLLAMIVVTGALHEDGLADCADGFWGGWTKDRRLEIMKDSHIGSYGVLALALSLLLRGAALNALISAGLMWPALLISASVGRSAMVLTMNRLPNARGSGLSQSVGRPSGRATAIALGTAAWAALVFAPTTAAWLVVFCGLLWFGCERLAKAKIGGQTGDVLGATGQVLEITVLLVMVVSA